MEIVSILRALWRHRILLALGIVPAVLAGLAMLYRVSPLPPTLTSKATETHIASTRVLLSAGRQKTPELTDAVNSSLPSLTTLLADRMATDAARAETARAAGIEPHDLAVFGPSSGLPMIAIPLATQAAEAARLAYEPYVLSLRIDRQVPLFGVRVSGPDADVAAKLVDATAVQLAELSRSDGPAEANLRVERLGPAVRTTLVDRPSPVLGVLAAIVVFLMWGSAVVLVGGMMTRRRRARAVTRTAAA